ncbi:MAG TPA: M48 family metallopeptidase, partial [Lysobacter sp.]|nr:M48 family metallopeptidase [Lysobacter sp.]
MSNVIGDASGIAAVGSTPHASPASAFARLAARSIPRPPSQPLYLASLWVVTVLCALMPLLYLGLIGGIAWLEYVHYTQWLPQLGRRAVMLHLAAWVLPGFVGAVLMLFLLKPLVAPRRKPVPSLRVAPGDEPELTVVVRGLCAAIGIRPPVAIEISHEANAWVQFEHGLRGMLSGRKVLTIGLPLVAGMNVRQFVGVLAHEFGHFAQGGGMRSAFIINQVNQWLYSRGYEDDAWDDRLDDWEEPGGWIGIAVAVAQLSLEVTRALMRAMFQLSFRSSRRLSQEMEFDADRYEAMVAGSTCFGGTALRLRAIALAVHQAGTRNLAAW